MPLIIVVLIIIVIFINAKDGSINNERKRREYTKSIRKTNAKLELKLVQQFYNRGENTDDRAIELARAELINQGFEPCIPRDAFRVDEYDRCIYVYHQSYNYQRFDSHAVSSLNEDFETQTDKTRIKFASQEEFEQKQEEYVYNNLPKTIAEYQRYLRLSITRSQAIRVGNFLSYPGLGTCEVIALDYDRLQHTVKVIQTGEIRKIAFGDKRIIRL